MLRATAVLVALTAGARPATEKPNVVLFFVDDLGYGDMGFTGHPSTATPNIDALAFNGKVMTTWYSGCALCSASRASLMTGRQWRRVGAQAVYGPTNAEGLNTTEVTVADVLKAEGYHTAAVGKWHLGQREMFMPGNRGFDEYLGIPYSDDMGAAYRTSCATGKAEATCTAKPSADPAGTWLPLVEQHGNATPTVVEQPLDFSTLSDKYSAFATDFVKTHGEKDEPFFLYFPFSHVHATWQGCDPAYQAQYSSCVAQNQTARGTFGDGLKDVDRLVGETLEAVKKAGQEENTLFLFTSDNGPWLVKEQGAGSMGLFYGRSAGYWNTGKGSTWEGGIRMPAFAYWPGVIEPHSRSAETVSSMDVMPTLAALSGSPTKLPLLDGKDMSDALLNNGKSPHQFLFIYSPDKTCGDVTFGPSAARFGSYKAHWCTSPGNSGCSTFNTNATCPSVTYDPPMLFNVDQDPSEAYALAGPEYAAVLAQFKAARDHERATFEYGPTDAPPLQPGEKAGELGLCCDRTKQCKCTGPTAHLFEGPEFMHNRLHAVTGWTEEQDRIHRTAFV